MQVRVLLVALAFAASMIGAARAQQLHILAAGSLREVIGDIGGRYKTATGIAVTADFGPSGVLRERIEKGEKADLFGSADMGHPLKLQVDGRATRVDMFARNALCAFAVPTVGLTTANFLDRLLDPAVKLGTSTPKADPAGDYTWLMFHRADKIHSGAYAILDRKAQQVVGGPKSLMASGTAILQASEKVVAKGRQIAAHVLEAAVEDIEFERGRFVIAGTDRYVGIMDLAAQLKNGVELPGDVPDSLDVQHILDKVPSAFPNGCHVAEVEIDPETGVVAVVKYSMVNDFGVIVNPLLVEGQAHGGVVQGIGQALMERVVFDEDGQFLTGSFMDYALPRASDALEFQINSHPVPAKTNPLGAKGCGEAGCAGSLPAVMNAVVDALSEYGIRHINMPATPFRVWQAIREAAQGGVT